MNKLFTKIVGVALGLTMAIGLGVAVASNSEAVPAHAAGNSYVKVTSAPSDWSGTYLLVYESSTTAGVAWTGVDAASCNVAVTIDNGKISDKKTAVELEIATMTDGYSIKVVGGDNNGKFIKGTSGSNTIGFDSNAQLNTISYDSTNKGVLITSNTSVMRYNSASNNYRFRYFKSSSYSSQKIVQLYKKEAATKTLSSITVSEHHRSFTVGDTFVKETVTATYSDSSTADVTSSASFSGYNMSTTGSQTVSVSYTEGGVTKTANYSITVSAPTAPTISLNGSSFTGYTGQSFSVTATYANLTSAFAWSTSGSGTTSESITSTGTATDGTSTYSGTLTGAGIKTLSATGGGATTQTYTVDVTQSLRPVMMETTSSSDDTLTWTEKCNGAGTSSNSKSWTITSDGTESNFDGTKGIHYGTGKAAVKYIKATSSAYTTGKITKVVVNASTASGVTATVGVKIGGISFGGNPQSISQDAADYTFTGEVNASSIEVEVTKPKSATNAIYLKSIIVTISTSSGTVDIANKSGHEAAQKAVVAFAKAMNAAFDKTANCTNGVAAAWETASSAYSSNIANNDSLSADEKAYAKNLIKYASAQYTKDTDNDYSYCLERAMATYETCIQKHGQTAFMSDVRLVSASSRIAPLSFINGDGNTIAIIIVISMISITAIGGYFFLRKRKEY